MGSVIRASSGSSAAVTRGGIGCLAGRRSSRPPLPGGHGPSPATCGSARAEGGRSARALANRAERYAVSCREASSALGAVRRVTAPAELSVRVYDRPLPTNDEETNVIDRLREQLQERLDQLARRGRPPAQGARRARPAPLQGARLASLAARKHCRDDRAKPAASTTKRTAARRAEPARGSLPSPDGARRDQGLRARGARRRRGDDRRRGCRQDRPRPPDCVDDAVEAREERRGGEGRARLSAAVSRRDSAFLAGRVAHRYAVLFAPRGRRYRGRVVPLGFRFDVDAVVIGGVAHRSNCREVADDAAIDAVHDPRRRGASRRVLPAGVPMLPAAVRDVADSSARAIARGARSLTRRPQPMASIPVGFSVIGVRGCVRLCGTPAHGSDGAPASAPASSTARESCALSATPDRAGRARRCAGGRVVTGRDSGRAGACAPARTRFAFRAADAALRTRRAGGTPHASRSATENTNAKRPRGWRSIADRHVALVETSQPRARRQPRSEQASSCAS